MRKVLAALTFAATLLASAQAARAAPKSLDAVNAILARTMIERAAYRACATRDKDSDTEAMLVRSWRLDLTETWDILRKAGYSEDDVRKIIDRFDLDKAKPRLDDAGLAAFCGTVDDWRQRVFLFMMSLPQPELRRLFGQ